MVVMMGERVGGDLELGKRMVEENNSNLHLRRCSAHRSGGPPTCPWSPLVISRLSTAVEASPIPKNPPEIVSRVPLTTADEFKSAIAAAKSAFPKWRNTPVTTRQRVMVKLQKLIRRDMVRSH